METKKRTVLITGSTSGIGKATALALAKRSWSVCIHGSREESCREVASEIRETSGNQYVGWIAADLSSVQETIRLADQIKEDYSNLDVLICNAGTFSMKRQTTTDGFEKTWMVNYLSRFLLIRLLLPFLKENGPSRIVDVSGAYHRKGKINFGDIHLEKNYSFSAANNQSKLANVLFTHKLNSELMGTSVTINTMHPGAVNTGAFLKHDDVPGFPKMMYRLFSLFFKRPEQGAEGLAFLATAPEMEGVSGRYFEGKKEKRSSAESYEEELQKKLWSLSENCLKPFIPELPG